MTRRRLMPLAPMDNDAQAQGMGGHGEETTFPNDAV
jgi:hypothetical protein